MKKNRRFLNLLPAMLMWLVLSVMVWGFVFSHLTDAPPAEKISLYVDGVVTEGTQLALALEEEEREGIRMVKVHPFSYAMMGTDIETADLFIVPEKNIETYRAFFAPWPESMEPGADFYSPEGTPLGRKVYDGETGEGIAKVFITYAVPGMERQNYYLFFGSRSVHVPGHETTADDAAIAYAKKLMTLQ